MKLNGARRGCLIGLLVLIVLVVAAVVVVRRALDAESLRGLAESRLTSALGQPVTVGRMDVSFLPTPSVEGRQVRVGAGTDTGAPSISLGAFRIVPRLSTLLSSHIVVDRIEVEGFTVRALRRKDGTWVVPVPSAPAASTQADDRATAGGRTFDIDRIVLKDGNLVVVDEGRLETSSPPGIRRIDAAMVVKDGAARLDNMKASIGGSTIVGHGSASGAGLDLALQWESLEPSDLPEVFGLLGSEAPPGLSVEGRQPLTLELKVDGQGAVSANGRLAASGVSLGTLRLTSFASPLQFASNRLALDPVTFEAYGGHERGSVTADLRATPVAWSLRSAMTGLDLDQFVSSNTSAKGKVSGIARLEADLRGTAAAPVERSVTGTVSIDVANGSIRQFPLLASLSSALKLGSAGNDRDLPFEKLSGTLHVANAAMTTDDLTARTGEVTLAASGRLGFDQSLDFTGTARYTRAASDDLVRRLKDLGGLRNPQGEIEVPFSVTGTASVPAFSIDLEKILQRAAQKEMKRQLNKQLNRIFKIK